MTKPQGPWRTAEQVEIATLDYVDWFNRDHHHQLEHRHDHGSEFSRE